MADTTNKPVIFLAFANDRDDTVAYLRNLPDEARRLRDVLQPAEQAGLCAVGLLETNISTVISTTKWPRTFPTGCINGWQAGGSPHGQKQGSAMVPMTWKGEMRI